jgi:GNAT superfamily N-acetyltransferase
MSEEDKEGERKDAKNQIGMVREATVSDVAAMNHLRLQVRENVLSDPSRITTAMTTDAISVSGCGWVFEENGQILGFSIALHKDPSIWALFVLPGHEGRGIGHALHEVAVNWLWSRGVECIWLSTDPGTRAERFYRKHGWREAGKHDNGDIRFELNR